MGGSAQEWGTLLPGELAPGSEVVLNLVMTKFGQPSARIGYEIRLEPVD